MTLPTLALGIGLLLAALVISRTWRAAAKKGMGHAIGICSFALDQTTRKQDNKQKIVTLFDTQKELTNTTVREHLNVSSRTVVNYMGELEKEGTIEQVGAVGQGVSYRLTNNS